ncbi:SWI/SNF complex component snf12 [Gonapodya sp. JEL0774]|nr:SWI/SNF complex component snf12 [Gonapodya sp. JEL0774]
MQTPSATNGIGGPRGAAGAAGGAGPGRGAGLNSFTPTPAARPNSGVFLLPSGHNLQQSQLNPWSININQLNNPVFRHNITQAALAAAQNQQQLKAASTATASTSRAPVAATTGLGVGLGAGANSTGLSFGPAQGAALPLQNLVGQAAGMSGFQAVHSSAQPQPSQVQVLPPPRPPRRARRPNLRHLPSSVSTSHPELASLYTSFLDTETQLDTLLAARRTGSSTATGLGASVGKTLPATVRVSLRVSVRDQAFQQTNSGAREDNLLEPGSLEAFEEEGPTPSWTLEVLGEVLEPEGAKRFQFTEFVSHVVFELHRDPELYPDGNTIEWTKSATHPPSDGFELTRPGDTATPVTMFLHLGVPPAPTAATGPAPLIDNSRYKLSPALENLLGGFGAGHTVGKAEVVGEIWRYVKANGLWEPGGVGGGPGWMNCEGEMGKLSQLDNQCNSLLARIDQSRLKRSFFTAFADDPATFVARWCESQTRDLAEVLGDREWDWEDLVGYASEAVGKDVGDTLVGVEGKRERLEKAVRAYVSLKVGVPSGQGAGQVAASSTNQQGSATAVGNVGR